MGTYSMQGEVRKVTQKDGYQGVTILPSVSMGGQVGWAALPNWMEVRSGDKIAITYTDSAHEGLMIFMRGVRVTRLNEREWRD